MDITKEFIRISLKNKDSRIIIPNVPGLGEVILNKTTKYWQVFLEINPLTPNRLKFIAIVDCRSKGVYQYKLTQRSLVVVDINKSIYSRYEPAVVIGSLLDTLTGLLDYLSTKATTNRLILENLSRKRPSFDFPKSLHGNNLIYFQTAMGGEIRVKNGAESNNSILASIEKSDNDSFQYTVFGEHELQQPVIVGTQTETLMETLEQIGYFRPVNELSRNQEPIEALA